MTNSQLEARLAAMEKQLAEIRTMLDERLEPKKDWMSTFGISAGDPVAKRVDEYALQYREKDRQRARLCLKTVFSRYGSLGMILVFGPTTVPRKALSWQDIVCPTTLGSACGMFFPNGKPRGDRLAIVGLSLMASCGSSAPAPLGATCPRNSGPGKPSGACSTPGTTKASSRPSWSSCARPMSMPASSIRTCGASMAPSSEPPAVPPGAEKKGFRGARGPRVGPQPGRFHDQNPPPV